MRLKNFSLIFLLVLFFQFPLIAFAFQIVLAEGSYESGSGPIGTWTPGGTSSSIEDVVSNSVYAFVAISGGSENGLAILDLSDKANPTKIGSLTTSDTVHSIELVNGIIALGAGSKLLFINISDPSNPTLIKNLTLHSTVYDLQEMGYFLAVGDYSGSLYVVNVTDTSNATIIWGYSDNPDPNNRWIQGLTSFFGSNYVYAAALSNGLHVWNLSDPSNPALIGSLNLGYSMYSAGMYDANTVVIGGVQGWVNVVDVSTATSPSLITSLKITSDVNAIYCSSGIIIIADYTDGLVSLKFDGSTLSLGRKMNTNNARGYGLDVAIGYVYFACSNGLLILNYNDLIPTGVSTSLPQFVGIYNNIIFTIIPIITIILIYKLKLLRPAKKI